MSSWSLAPSTRFCIEHLAQGGEGPARADGPHTCPSFALGWLAALPGCRAVDRRQNSKDLWPLLRVSRIFPLALHCCRVLGGHLTRPTKARDLSITWGRVKTVLMQSPSRDLLNQDVG